MADYRPSFENNVYIYKLIDKRTGEVITEGETSGRGSRSDQKNEAHVRLMREGFHPMSDPDVKFWIKRKDADENSIRELRESTGLSRKAFCDKYGIPYRTMQDWEDGKSKPVEWAEGLLRRVVREDFPR